MAVKTKTKIFTIKCPFCKFHEIIHQNNIHHNHYCKNCKKPINTIKVTIC